MVNRRHAGGRREVQKDIKKKKKKSQSEAGIKEGNGRIEKVGAVERH